MNRIQQVLKNRKAFILFITAGDPDLSATEALVPTAAEASTGLIELGISPSDPVAEGVVIQETDLRSLASGITTDKIFDTMRWTRQKTGVPLAFMTYINPVFAYGVDKFMKNAADCGIDALIVSDTLFEEREELLPTCKKYDVTLIYLVAPTSREQAQAIAREFDRFVYCVSSLEAMGIRSEIATNIKEMVDTVKQGRNAPCVIGFGVSTSEQASKIVSQAGEVIVRNIITKMIARYGINCVEPVCDYVKQMETAVGIQTVRTG